jgi:hypothetical protein
MIQAKQLAGYFKSRNFPMQNGVLSWIGDSELRFLRGHDMFLRFSLAAQVFSNVQHMTKHVYEA